MKNILTLGWLMLSTLVAMPVLAHEGHGATPAGSFFHDIEHGVWFLASAGIVLVVAYFFNTRSRSK